MTALAREGNRSAQRYLADSLATAGPTTLLVMLYDRLVLDLRRAEEAQLAGDRSSAHDALLHAQAIVFELQSSLKPDVWDGSEQLQSLYAWLAQELVTANITGDAARTGACRTEVVEPLAGAWREAALLAAAQSTTAAEASA